MEIEVIFQLLFSLAKSIFTFKILHLFLSKGCTKKLLFCCNFFSYLVPFPVCYVVQLVLAKLNIVYYNCFYIREAYCVPGTVLSA